MGQEEPAAVAEGMDKGMDKGRCLGMENCLMAARSRRGRRPAGMHCTPSGLLNDVEKQIRIG